MSRKNKIHLDKNQRVIIHNMSQSDVAFYTTSNVKPGQIFRISIDIYPTTKPIVLYGVIVRHRLQLHKWTSVGAKFNKPLSNRTIKQIQTVTPVHSIN